MIRSDRDPPTRPAERTLFFTDAVVAIAMTLLILPLLESVTEASRSGLGALDYAQERAGQLAAFALSFLVIGLFWSSHDRLFEQVVRIDAWVWRLNLLWMFTIVLMPVTTAMVGAMETDPAQLAIYMGTMLASSLLILAMQLRLVRTPPLREPGQSRWTTQVTPTIITSALFAAALLLALTVPGVQFWSLLLLLLRSPLEILVSRTRSR